MDTRQRIIDTAFEMIKEKSYEEVSVNDICEKCGITKPTFYKYIGAKENLLTNFYDNVTAEFADTALHMLAADNYWEQICTGFDAILGWSEEFGPDLYSQLFISDLKNNKGTFDFNAPLAAAMVSLFKKAQEAGQIHNPGNAEALYFACVHLSFGYGVVWCLNNGSSDLLADFRNALETVCQVDEKYRQKSAES